MRHLTPITLLPVAAAVIMLVTSRPATAADSSDFLASLSDWKVVTDSTTDLTAVCTLAPDGVVAVTGKPIGYLTTTATFQNYRLHAEWRWTAQPGNGGILLHIATGPKDRQWPQCFQIQLKHTRAGDILPMAGATFAELPSPEAKQIDRRADSSEHAPGEWNTCDVVCRGDTIECVINGVTQNHISRCAPAAGTIGFQLEGTPFELRHVRIEPLE